MIDFILYKSIQAVINSNVERLKKCSTNSRRMMEFVSILLFEFEDNEVVKNEVIPMLNKIKSSGEFTDDTYINAIYRRVFIQM